MLNQRHARARVYHAAELLVGLPELLLFFIMEIVGIDYKGEDVYIHIGNLEQ
jgi:hypothetical protein